MYCHDGGDDVRRDRENGNVNDQCGRAVAVPTPA